jgi:small-conductance mechanosensitive channel
MTAPERRKFWSPLFAVLLKYGARLAFSAAGLWIVLQLGINVLDLLIAFRVSPWSTPVIDKTATILLFLVWLVGVMWLEHYLASAQERREFWRRIKRVAVAEVGALLFSYGLQALI